MKTSNLGISSLQLTTLALSSGFQFTQLPIYPFTNLPTYQNYPFTNFLIGHRSPDFRQALDLAMRLVYNLSIWFMGSAVRIRHCPATVFAENLSSMPLGTPREGAQSSLRRKSGDRPDARHWAFPAALGGPESFFWFFA
jgi:hypothetical protein